MSLAKEEGDAVNASNTTKGQKSFPPAFSLKKSKRPTTGR